MTSNITRAYDMNADIVSMNPLYSFDCAFLLLALFLDLLWFCLLWFGLVWFGLVCLNTLNRSKTIALKETPEGWHQMSLLSGS